MRFESLQALSTCASAFASIGYYSQTLLSGAADIIARDPIGIGLQVKHCLPFLYDNFPVIKAAHYASSDLSISGHIAHLTGP